MSELKTRREGKGPSIIDFPENYTVIDIETTGLDPQYCEIIEISAIRYEGSREIDSFSNLVKPEQPIDSFITSLTGITNEMVENAPSISEVILNFYHFIGEDILVGYNVGFDINFLYDNLKHCHNIPLSNPWINIMRIAKKILPEQERYTQPDIAAYYRIRVEKAHRAEADCETCHAIFEAMKKDILDRGQSFEDIKKMFSRGPRSKDQLWRAKDIVADTTEIDVTNPIYGKYCVITGKLEKMDRKTAAQLVVNRGGIYEDRVTKKTNFLIMGNLDFCSSVKEGKSRKFRQAEEYILKGQDLKILSETVFYDMLSEDLEYYPVDEKGKYISPKEKNQIKGVRTEESQLITPKDRKEMGLPSERGLYVSEIFLLDSCKDGTLPNYQNKYPAYWKKQYGIQNVNQVLYSLEKRGFLRMGTAKESVGNQKADQLRKILKKNGLSTSGKKADLVNRVSENISEVDLYAAGVEKKYILTDLGKLELEDNAYVIYMLNNPNQAWEEDPSGMVFNVWSINSMLGKGDKSNWKEIVNREEQKLMKEREEHQKESYNKELRIIETFKDSNPERYEEMMEEFKESKAIDEKVHAVNTAEHKYNEDHDLDAYIKFWEDMWSKGGLDFYGLHKYFTLADLYIKAGRYSDAMNFVKKRKEETDDPRYLEAADQYIEKIEKKIVKQDKIK